MEREIDLKEISDGKLYSSSDMVKADCGDCKGCSACCQGMGSSILLDPYDIYRLSTGTDVYKRQHLAESARSSLKPMCRWLILTGSCAGPICGL